MIRIATRDIRFDKNLPDFLLGTDGRTYYGRFLREVKLSFPHERDEHATLNILLDCRPDETANAAYLDLSRLYSTQQGFQLIPVFYYRVQPIDVSIPIQTNL